MVEAVCFDLDDTLCVYRRSADELLDLAFHEVGLDPFFTASEYYGIFEDHAEGASGIEEIRERCFAALAADAGYDRSLGWELASTYTAERDQTAVDPMPGTYEALESLEQPLSLVTNGPPAMQSTKVEALDLGDYFEHTVYAGFDTASKPAAEPFERALAALDVDPDQAIHVGNSLDSDVRGAVNAGMDAAWIPSGGDGKDEAAAIEPTYVLKSLHDLCDPPWE